MVTRNWLIRRGVRNIVFISALVFLLFASAVRAAQPEAKEEAKKPKKLTAEGVVRRAFDAYQGLSSYQDTSSLSQNVEFIDPQKGDVKQNAPALKMRLKLENPGRLSVVIEGQQAMYCNGEKVWLYSPVSKQYIVKNVPEGKKALDMLSQSVPHPLTVNSEAELEGLLGQIKLAGVKEEKWQKQDGKLVTGSAAMPDFMAASPIQFKAWFSDSDGLLRWVRVDMKDMMAAVFEKMAAAGQSPAEVVKADAFFLIEGVRLNEDIPDEEFTFTPGQGDKEYTQLKGTSSPEALIGGEAPGFSTPTLGGKAVSLSDLRGKVVVLDFWATWCGPCGRALPMLENVAEYFADKPVAIMGVNLDRGGTDGVAKFVQKNGLTFPQALDSDGSISNRYVVNVIPTSFVIDQEGIVRHVHIGFDPQYEETLKKEIGALLK